MIKLNSLTSFAVLAEGKEALFAAPDGSDQSRKVKMRVNTPHDVTLWISPVEDLDVSLFLGRVRGHEQFEFFFDGSFVLTSMGGDIWLDTFDNTQFDIQAKDPVSYARLFEREERDPRILEIERAARHNMEALRREMRADLENHKAALDAAKQADKPASAGSGNKKSDPAQGSVVPSGSDEKAAGGEAGGAGASDAGNAAE